MFNTKEIEEIKEPRRRRKSVDESGIMGKNFGGKKPKNTGSFNNCDNLNTDSNLRKIDNMFQINIKVPPPDRFNGLLFKSEDQFKSRASVIE
jgi:hypothetical protein